MSANSKIEWTDTTWNPLAGCTPVSEGCRNCYAANHARRLAGNPNPKVSGPYEGTARTAGDGRAVFTGRVNLIPERLEEPLRWRKPRRVFVNAMSDLFHPDVPLEFVDRVFAVMALCPQHTFQVLTKRPERMAEYFLPIGQTNRSDWVWAEMGRRLNRSRLAYPKWPLPNVWLGTSVENQAAADERIPHLLRCPAAVRFLSCEPLLGPVGLRPWLRHAHIRTDMATGKDYRYPAPIHWLIAGGESGRGARPCDVAWLRSLRDQCAAAGVPYFLKQMGADPGYTGAGGPGTHSPIRLLLRDPKGGDPEEWPHDLRVREFPEPRP
ncbi:MAG: hypothetical protein AMXMBFR53_36750 [Gemmatimonadota bacterium]